MAVLLRWGLGILVGEGLPTFTTFYPVIMFSALLGGTGPGLLATALSALAAAVLILSAGSDLGMAHPANQVGLALFCAVSVAISFVCGALRAARANTMAQEERLRATFDQAAMGIIEMDRDDRIIAANQRICQILGYSREELLGLSLHELTHPKDRPMSHQFHLDLRQGRRKQIDYEKCCLKRDRPSIWVRVNVSAVQDHQGNWQHSIATVEDISERKEAELALRRSEVLYRTMARSLPEGAMSVVDSHLRYLIVEGQLLPRLGLSMEGMAGRSVEEVFEGETGRVRAEYFRRALGGEVASYETEYHGRMIWSQFVPLLDGDGQVLGAMSVAIDVTERERAKEDLRQARDALAGANADLERKVQERTAKLTETIEELECLSYSMIHDMRAPLRAMQGYAAVLESEWVGSLPAESLEYFRRIRESTNRLDRLITGALNYNHVVRQDLPLEPVELGRLLRGMVESYPNLQPVAVEIHIEFEELVVLGNESLLTQCFGNLLDNAAKFVGHEVKPRIRLWAEACDKMVRIWVEDNGIGIPEAARAHIFHMFQRVSHGGEHSGTGAGLAVVRKAVERMGGRVGVESDPGKGSRFWVELGTPQQP